MVVWDIEKIKLNLLVGKVSEMSLFMYFIILFISSCIEKYLIMGGILTFNIFDIIWDAIEMTTLTLCFIRHRSAQLNNFIGNFLVICFVCSVRFLCIIFVPFFLCAYLVTTVIIWWPLEEGILSMLNTLLIIAFFTYVYISYASLCVKYEKEFGMRGI